MNSIDFSLITNECHFYIEEKNNSKNGMSYNIGQNPDQKKKKILFALIQSSFQILPACDESIWKLTQWAREIHEMCWSLGIVPN